MRDFTLQAYKRYLLAIKRSYPKIICFSEYFNSNPKPESFCLLRHDVDRKPLNALKMAKLENSIGVKATYCFRTKKHTFKPGIISKISKMGHEIAYHYESLSDANGNMERAIKDFEKNLAMLRKIVPVSTISMHGRPLKPYDNRDIWKNKKNHEKLVKKYNLLGEIYIDIDYTDIAYINDTGRNWNSTKSNLRDKVNSKIKIDFSGGQRLLNYLNNEPHPKLIFQIHPERWSDNYFEYIVQFLKDKSINFVKCLL
jgi:hypothetical protein